LLKIPGIITYIDFSRRDIKKVITRRFFTNLYHELSHLAREAFVGWGRTFLDHLVAEGIASYTEKALDNRAEVPYIRKIKNEDELWRKAKPFLSRGKYRHSDWFFGSRNIPRWAGYRLGYLIVDSFMKNNDCSLYELTRMPSKEILRKSNF